MPDKIALICFETGFIISSKKPVYGVSCPADNGVRPICDDCLSKIPEKAKRKGIGANCEFGERGIDVYKAVADSLDGETYDQSTFQSGKIAFSLSEPDAKRYLPESWKKLPAPPAAKRRIA